MYVFYGGPREGQLTPSRGRFLVIERPDGGRGLYEKRRGRYIWKGWQ